MTFSDLYKIIVERDIALVQIGTKPKAPDHQKMAVRGLSRKKQSHVDRYKKRVNDGEDEYRGWLNNKIEAIRYKKSSREVLHGGDIDFIQKKYDFDIDKIRNGTPRSISNSHILLYFDPNLNSFCLKDRDGWYTNRYF